MVLFKPRFCLIRLINSIVGNTKNRVLESLKEEEMVYDLKEEVEGGTQIMESSALTATN